MVGWHFMPKRRGDTTRDSLQDEFFATDAISNQAEALVREGIQNALDAAVDGSCVYVRIGLFTGKAATAPSKVSPFMEGLWPHIASQQSGLHEPPSPTDPCPFLVFEDFGTSGLNGDVAQSKKEDHEKNGFFTFFRAEGYSDKGDEDRGRWGVGKIVFPKASAIRSFWGLTVRSSDHQRLLMGRAILKTHEVHGEPFLPDGYYGIVEDEFVMPISDDGIINQLREAFRLNRNDESGLSVVVPWCDSEMSVSDITKAVIEGYFYPILTKALIVSLDGPDGQRNEISDTKLVGSLARLDEGFSKSMRPLIELAIWARDASKMNFCKTPRPPESGALKWNQSLMPTDLAKAIRAKLSSGEPIAIRVQMPVREKGAYLKWSYFDVFMIRDGLEQRTRPVFVREGIIIPDVRGKSTHGIRALVVIEDKPLAKMLGDAENPAHTQWQKDGSKYKGKYPYGEENIRFVANSVAQLVSLATENEQEADPAVLIDLFSLPASPDAQDSIKVRGKRPNAKNQGPEPAITPQLPPAKPKPFLLQQVAGGFRLTHGDTEAATPRALEVRVAYDLRTGNPLRKYHTADFELDKAPIQIGDDLSGMEIVERRLNFMKLKILQPAFKLSVTGFDENRDIYVQVLVREGDDGDSADELHGAEEDQA